MEEMLLKIAVSNQNIETGSDTLMIGLIVGLGAFVLLLVGGFIIIILLYRRKQRRNRVILVDPKYDIIAFSPWDGSLYDRKNTNNLSGLEELLMEDEMSLIVALGAITQATEGDNLARSLIYLFESHGKTLDLIYTFIDIEITTCKDFIKLIFQPKVRLSSDRTA